MPDHVLEEELRPARAVELDRPRWQRLVAHRGKQARAPERQIDEHRRTTLERERQDTIGRGAVVDRIIDLDEVERFLLQHPLHFPVLRVARGGDADVAVAPGRLALAHGGELGRGVREAMHLDEVDLPGTQALERIVHFLDPRRAPA